LRLNPLYTVRFRYPDGWEVALTGDNGREEFHYYFAEGTCTGELSGRFRAGNHPRRRSDRTAAMDLQGFIETDDGGLVMVDYQGYGRAYPQGRRQVVGAAWHISDHQKYKRLNDGICVIAGEVRTPPDIPPDRLKQADVELVFDVSELMWEAPAD
jgi:Protein of unknown function (DUF3237)